MKHMFRLVAAVVMAAFACGCATDRGPRLPKVVFTFDDGFTEHYDIVAPILEKYGFRGSFNVVVGSVGRPKHMTWDQLRDLDRRGHAIENHTMTHPNMVALAESNDTARIERELTLARDEIASAIGRAPTFVCLPYSRSNAAVDMAIRDSWQKPMCCCRRNFGEGYAPGDATRYIDERVAQGRRVVDLLCHGVTANGPGYKPFASPEAFEAFVKEVKELVDRKQVKVVLYRDCEVY